MVEQTRQAWPAADSQVSRLPSLTGLRFVAAAMVFLHHTTFANLWLSPDAADRYISVVSMGNVGVSFFFVLSGFVLTWSARSTDNPPRFWRRRFFKIYPNHALVFVVSALLIGYSVTTFGVTPLDTWDAVLNLLLLHAWPHDLALIFSVNLVTWSLACEVFFYLMFPFILPIIRKIRPERLWTWAALVTAAIIAAPFFARLLPDEPPIPQVGLTTWEIWFLQVFPPIRMLEFLLGILLARIVLSGRQLPIGIGGAAALTVAAYALTPLFPAPFRLAATMVIPLGLLIAASAASDMESRRSWLGSRPMVWLGEISYAFYLWHYMVIMTTRSIFDSPTGWATPTAFAVLGLMFVTTLVLAWLLYSTVERPVMRRFATSRRDRARRAEIRESPATEPAPQVPGGALQ